MVQLPISTLPRVTRPHLKFTIYQLAQTSGLYTASLEPGPLIYLNEIWYDDDHANSREENMDR